VRKQVLPNHDWGKQRTEWVHRRLGVPYLLRYREVSLQANARDLDALAVVDDPTQGKQALQCLTTAKKDAAGRSCPGFSPGRRGSGLSTSTRPCADTASVRPQSIGATSRHTVQEPDGRRAMPARIHEPGHPSTADVHAVAALVRRRFR